MTMALGRGFQFKSAARSHPGAKRSLNEDRILESSTEGLWAVADGMGGHRAGDAAAACLVEALATVTHGASGYACLSDIVAKVDKVNATLFSEGEGNSISGSTLVALLIHEGHYACLWAGDSRAYLLRDGELTQITRDHSVVQQMVDYGVLSDAERRGHPGAHVVTRAVGAGPHVTLEQRFAPVAHGDIFLLCSDGLTGALDEQLIALTVVSSDLTGAADGLMEAALAAQASDNVSYIIVKVDNTLG